MIVHRCPECSYLVSDLEFKLVKFDFTCPVCDHKKLSEFAIEEMPTNEPTGNQQAAREALH
jgi:hypothetical protein